ncbi:Fe(3+)-hydroxamate ABC transporter permease FhuB [Pandoraea fibrosis]|uniref:Fe3+-hydroxamate ABC transporter permease FhuB n=1 Tax=Pandoraea fibrosis TaxID=1891094 RepID=A0A5E4SLW3_9BURK|nr:Fe(3+)-hydroxamate ABC transporter permease FhuB [Pandoraea fibrosis]VVD75318.1 Fe3+-hydroxamate ABC transporter permease FhuB [Pandoraea fibrosis]
MSTPNPVRPMTAGSTCGASSPGAPQHLWRLALIVGLPALALVLTTFLALRPAGVDGTTFLSAVWHAIVTPAFEAQAPASPAALSGRLVNYAWLPRLAMSALAGAGLSLAGVMFQQVLRNPLAEPLTLGVASGAFLALSAAAIWMPWLALAWRAGLALGGATLAVALVMALTWRSRFAPVPVILAGMVVNLYCSGLTIMLSMTHERALVGVFAWGAGSLVQNGWHDVFWLLPCVVVGAIAAALLLRPLTLFTLDDSSISQLGARVAWIRTIGLGVAVALSACIISVVGVIGFVGLAAPQLVRLAGARRLRDQLRWAPFVGGLMLILTDQIVQCLPLFDGATLPTGAAAALLGGPLLLWLLQRTRAGEVATADATPPARAHHAGWCLAFALAFGVGLMWLTLHSGRTLDGWQWATSDAWTTLWVWRVPRMVASAAAGVALALAGTLLQRISGNPMASPELLGVSGGAMLGVLIVTWTVAGPRATTLFGAAFMGAVVSLVVMLTLARKGGFSPTRVLLAGVAISGMAHSLVAIVSASGTANAFLLRSLMLGLTYVVGPGIAALTAVGALVGLLLTCLAARWLDLLPMGEATATAVGVNVKRARVWLWCLAAALSAVATLVVGPLSFVGLLAPHLARLAGFGKGRSQAVAAAVAGALLMIAADWLGRNLMFPQQLPAGVLAMLIGAPYLLWHLRRQVA